MEEYGSEANSVGLIKCNYLILTEYGPHECGCCSKAVNGSCWKDVRRIDDKIRSCFKSKEEVITERIESKGW